MKIDFSDLLIPIFVVLVVLKLGGVTPEFSWWAVTAPLWVPFLLIGVIFLLMFIVAFLMSLVKK